MSVITGVDGQLTPPFTSFPAVRECTTLYVLLPPRRLTVAEILEWLAVDARSKQPKRLEMVDMDLGDSVGYLVQQLKKVGDGAMNTSHVSPPGSEIFRGKNLKN